jgi:hypothetical protein
MRIAINRRTGRPRNGSVREYVVAAMWPRSRAANGGNPCGGGSSIRQQKADLEEVRVCMAKPREHTATVFDVALECHMTDNMAHRLMKELKFSWG